jgi:hypothetical protein
MVEKSQLWNFTYVTAGRQRAGALAQIQAKTWHKKTTL